MGEPSTTSAPAARSRRPITPPYRWTAAEDALLRREWTELGWRELRRQLRQAFLAARPDLAPAKVRQRTRIAICNRVHALGMQTGIPQGFVSVKRAARVLGYHHRQMVALLARQGVAMRVHWCAQSSHYAKTTRRRSAPWRLVDLDEARAAVLRDLAVQSETETIFGAARRRGVGHVWLWRRVRDAGLVPAGRAGRTAVRLPSATIDALIAAPQVDRRRRRAHAEAA